MTLYVIILGLVVNNARAVQQKLRLGMKASLCKQNHVMKLGFQCLIRACGRFKVICK
jgi:hypothetical protein